MRYVAAFMLSSLNGKEPTSSDVERILGSVGVDVDSSKLELVFKELKGKNIDELLKCGLEKLAAVPSGGAVATGPAVATSTGTTDAAPAESKKEEKKEEEPESEDDDMGFSLFD